MTRGKKRHRRNQIHGTVDDQADVTLSRISTDHLLRALGQRFGAPDAACQKPSISGPNLRLVLNAEAIGALSDAMSQTRDEFDLRKARLEEEVATRTASIVDLSHRLELIFDSITDGIVTYNQTGAIESCNRSARQIFGLSNELPPGLQISDLIGSNIDAMKDTDSPVLHDIALKRGGSAHLEVNVRPIAGSVNGARMLRLRDMTDVRDTKRRLKEKVFLVDNVQAIVLTVKPTGILEWCNHHTRLLTGYDQSALEGRHLADLVDFVSSPDGVCDIINDALREPKQFNVEAVLKHRTGRAVWAQLECHPMFNERGELDQFVAMGIDITERKRQEQLQVDFCSMVSHELRTPLTVISGTMDAMQAGLSGDLPETAHELLDMGRRNCIQLSVLIEDILDVNKLESGVVRFESERIPIDDPLREAVATIMPLLNDAGLKLRQDIETLTNPVFADPHRLRQVFTNLLSNAIKFSRPGTELAIGVTYQSASVRVSITDCGPGIPVDFEPHMFKKFSRDVQVQAGGKEGFGLGLCISKGILDQMGGQISFESVPNEGTTFFVDFPLVVDRTELSAAVQIASQSNRVTSEVEA